LEKELFGESTWNFVNTEGEIGKRTRSQRRVNYPEDPIRVRRRRRKKKSVSTPTESNPPSSFSNSASIDMSQPTQQPKNEIVNSISKHSDLSKEEDPKLGAASNTNSDIDEHPEETTVQDTSTNPLKESSSNQEQSKQDHTVTQHLVNPPQSNPNDNSPTRSTSEKVCIENTQGSEEEAEKITSEHQKADETNAKEDTTCVSGHKRKRNEPIPSPLVKKRRKKGKETATGKNSLLFYFKYAKE